MDINKIATALRAAYNFIPYSGNRDQESNEQLRAQIRQLLAECEAQTDAIQNAAAYDKALNDMGLCPNGDDYNNLCLILRGVKIMPHKGGR